MKIDIISDIHLDFFIKQKDYTEKAKNLVTHFVEKILPPDPSNVLCLAGDIGHYNTQTKMLLEEFLKYYKAIFITHGNHELYLVSNNQRDKYGSSFAKVKELKDMCSDMEGVHYLDGNVVEYNDVRFGGLPGWYSITSREELQAWNNFTNDAHLIFTGTERPGLYSHNLRPKADFDTVKFYEEQEYKLRTMEECDVLMSHVAQVHPPESEISPLYQGQSSNVFYYVDNRYLVNQTQAKMHIYGHTHDFQEYHDKGLHMVCNPFGYPHENKNAKIYQVDLT